MNDLELCRHNHDLTMRALKVSLLTLEFIYEGPDPGYRVIEAIDSAFDAIKRITELEVRKC